MKIVDVSVAYMFEQCQCHDVHNETWHKFISVLFFFLLVLPESAVRLYQDRKTVDFVEDWFDVLLEKIITCQRCQEKFSPFSDRDENFDFLLM